MSQPPAAPIQLQTDTRLGDRCRWAGGIAAVLCLLLAGWILLRCAPALLPGAEQQSGSPNSGAVLLIRSAAQDPGQFNFLQAGMSAAGLSWSVWVLPEDPAVRAAELEAEVQKLAVISNCSAADIWLAAVGDAAPAIWISACRLPQAAGMVLFIPAGFSGLTAPEILLWPDSRPLALFAGQETNSGRLQAERVFYEQLTGEDATLFPGYQPGFGQPVQYLSADGRFMLRQYPSILPSLAMVSPRILPDALNWIIDHLAENGGFDPAMRSSAADLLTRLPFSLLLTALLLLAALCGLNLFLHRQPVQPAALTDKAWRKDSRLNLLANVLAWLPAAVLAAALGYLAAWLISASSDPSAWLFWSLAVMPGCYGASRQLIRLTCRARQRQTGIRRPQWIGTDAAIPQELAGACRLPAGAAWPGWAGGLALLAIMVLAGLLIRLAFGSLTPGFRSGLILPVLIILNWPAGMAGADPGDGKSAALFGQHLLYLLLPVWAGLFMGWMGLISGLALLAVHFWSAGLGKAARLVSRSRIAGGLARSLGYSAGVLLPPIIQGFFH
ncbi:MAG TPA: hypothetical protein DD640_01050 [Clostridiales bacterium]|nr:hypothetical protein [Clostridiales bacterium]